MQACIYNFSFRSPFTGFFHSVGGTSNRLQRVSLLDYRRGFGHVAYGRALSRQDGRLTWDNAAASA